MIRTNKLEFKTNIEIGKKVTLSEPLILVKAIFCPVTISQENIKTQEINPYSQSTQGGSTPKDFNFECHIKSSDSASDFIASFIPDISKRWLNITPCKDNVIEVITNVFTEGLKSLQNFVRWSKNGDLKVYASILEEWDEMIGDEWDEPESIYLNPNQCLIENETFRTQSDLVVSLLDNSYNKLDSYIDEYTENFMLYWRNQKFNSEILFSDKVLNATETLSNVINHLKFQAAHFGDNIPVQSTYGIFRIDSSDARKKLIPSPVATLKHIETNAEKMLYEKCEFIRKWIMQSVEDLSITAETVDTFVKQNMNLSNVKEKNQLMKDRLDIIGSMYTILTESQIKTKKDHKAYHIETLQFFTKLAQSIDKVETNQSTNGDKFKYKLENELTPQILTDIEKIKEQVSDQMFLEHPEKVNERLAKIDELSTKFKNLEELSKRYQEYEKVLNIDENPFSEIIELKSITEQRVLLWHSLNEWNSISSKWVKDQFRKINEDRVAIDVQTYNETIQKLSKELPKNTVLSDLKLKVDTFGKSISVIKSLRNNNLNERHWVLLKDMLKNDLQLDNQTFTFGFLLDLHATDFVTQIQDISTQATQETLLKNQISEIETLWNRMMFAVKPHSRFKDLVLLDINDTLIMSLDESLATINSILGSRYVKPILTLVDNWKNLLTNLQNVIEEWMIVQRRWLHLEKIFNSPDLKKVLNPELASKFETVDKHFRGLMQRVEKIRGPIRILKSSGNLINALKNDTKGLEEIESKLDEFLETKRMLFPRLYHLTNEELITLLSDSQNPLTIQISLRKCFDAAYKIMIKDPYDIKAFISLEGESLDLNKPVRIKESIEEWMIILQKEMKDTIRLLIKNGFRDLENENWKEWSCKHLSQVVIAIAQALWTTDTEDKIMQSKANPGALAESYEELIRQIDDSVSVIQSPDSSKVLKLSLMSLLVLQTHSRDIIGNLAEANICSITDFKWLSQLRYYLEDETVVIRQLYNRDEYGYEYIGIPKRMVMCSNNDACRLAISNAMRNRYIPNIVGEPSSGKTEIIYELARSIAMPLANYMCSQETNRATLFRRITGTLQQGAWINIGELSKCSLDILSTLSQLLMQIRCALASANTHIMIEGMSMTISKSYALFISISNGINKEIPVTLRTIIRTIALVAPAIQTIAEGLLTSYSFSNVKETSNKLVKCINLIEYFLVNESIPLMCTIKDIKFILYSAYNIRGTDPKISDEDLIVYGIRKLISSKLLGKYSIELDAILKEVFGETTVIKDNESLLQAQLIKDANSLNLYNTDNFAKKAIQLHESLEHNNSVIFIGGTGTGKTQCITLLVDTINKLSSKEEAKQTYKEIIMSTIFPNTLSPSELIGEYDTESNEWKNGLLSKSLKDASAFQEGPCNYLVIDGNIDEACITSVNGITDGTMLLQLANGERLKPTKDIKVIFELDNLEHAPPNAVSKCGVLYIDSTLVGWKGYAVTWINRRYPQISPTLHKYFCDNFELIFEKALCAIRTNLEEYAKSTDIQLVKNVCELLEVKLHINSLQKPDEADSKKHLLTILSFCIAWGMGASLSERSKDQFDITIRSLFEAVGLPPAQSILDYSLDEATLVFSLWPNPDYAFNPNINFYNIYAPSQDFLKYCNMANLYYNIGKSFIFTGLPNVGKSATLKYMLNDLIKSKPVVGTYLTLNYYSTAYDVQAPIEDKLEKKKKAVYGGPSGKKPFICIDDLNLPRPDSTGSQPPIEVIRMLLDKKGLHDKTKRAWKSVEDLIFGCAASSIEGDRYAINPRCLSKFTVFSLPNVSKQLQIKIFSSMLTGFLKGKCFHETVIQTGEDLISASIEVLNKITEELKPVPSRFHFNFSNKEIAKILNGIMMAVPESITTGETIIKLWAHEVMRTISDKIFDAKERHWFHRAVLDIISKVCHVALDFEEVFGKKEVMYSDLLTRSTSKLYAEVKEPDKLIECITNGVEEYNKNNQNSKLCFIIYEEALKSIVQICRSLRQIRGQVTIIGPHGCGKSTLVKLSAFLLKLRMCKDEVYKQADPPVPALRDILKDLYVSTGVQGVENCLALNDEEMDIRALSDINSLLYGAEVSSLFTQDELNKIYSDSKTLFPGIDESKPSILQSIFERARNNTRVALCFNTDPQLKVKVRRFPALLNSHIIWLTHWPESVLTQVSATMLSTTTFPNEPLKANINNVCHKIHSETIKYATTHKHTCSASYVSSAAIFTDFLNMFIELTNSSAKDTGKSKERICSFVNKVAEAKNIISTLKIQIEEIQPKLRTQSDKIDSMLKKINEGKKELEEKEKAYSQDNDAFEDRAKKTQELADDAEKDLNVLKPELDIAMDEIKKIDKTELSDIKNIGSPHIDIVLVLEAVMLLIGEDKEWTNIKKVLNDPNVLIDRLLNFSPEIGKVSDANIKKLKSMYISKPNFNPKEIVNKSKPCKALCIWVIAMGKLADITKKNNPKKQMFSDNKLALEKEKDALSNKQKALDSLKEKVAGIRSECEKCMFEKNKLSEDMDRSKKRYTNAEKLIFMLSDDALKFQSVISDIDSKISSITGDILLSAAYITYAGSFPFNERKELVSKWSEICTTSGISVTKAFSLAATIGDQIVIRDWCNQGLPNDENSIDNALITLRSQRWPVLLDTQLLGKKWLENMEKKNKLAIISMKNKEWLQDLTNSIKNGEHVLLVNYTKWREYDLECLMSKTIISKGATKSIKIANTEIPYNDQFKLYIIEDELTYSFSLSILNKVNLVLFELQEKTVEEQLLGDLVKKEKSDIEEQRIDVQKKINDDNKLLKNCEDKLIKALSENTIEQILDSSKLIDLIDDCKKSSKVVSERLLEVSSVEQDLVASREKYRPIATRGAIIYFAINRLSFLNPTYYYSYSQLKKVFNTAIEAIKSTDDRINKFILSVNETLTTHFSKILTTKDKLIFYFLVVLQIKLSNGDITMAEYQCFIRDVKAKNINTENPIPLALTDSTWEYLTALEKKSGKFTNLTKNIYTSKDKWSDAITNHSKFILPDPYKSISPFCKLLLIKGLRPEIMGSETLEFVKSALGAKILDVKFENVGDCIKQTDCFTPLILYTHPKTQCTMVSSISKYANIESLQESLKVYQLTSETRSNFDTIIGNGVTKGDMVVIQNENPMAEWGNLDIVLNNWLCKKELVDTFRLILLNPIECRIPIDIVNKSIKRFIEESSSIKSNLSRIFNHMESSTLEQSNKPVWKPLLFSLCFFHAAITSRFSYAPNQMSSPLLITDSELESSISMVKNIVDEQEQIDWNSISYFVGECGYASKCVSEFDKKIMCCYFNKIIEPSAIQPNHRYSESDLYYLPLIENIQSIFTYIDKLPAVDSGIIFGLSDHANFLHSQLQSSSMFATLYKIDPSVDTIEKDNNKIVLDCINDIMGHLPPELDEKLAHKTIFAKLSNNILQPVTVVLQQEIKKYNILLHTMSQLFDSILKYTSGQCQPSLIIEESFSQILINQIPSAIQKVNYCTHKSLSSWIKDLNTRISFFYKWLTKGRPAEYWLPAFYYPKGFLLSVIREHSLKNKIEFDHLGMSYEVLNPLENNDSDDGVSIFGLFLEGAKFSTEKDSLEDQSPPSWYFEMPSILCLPVENLSIAPEYYNCPLYYTQSKDMKEGNLLGSIDLPTSSRNSEYWSLKGVALHCQINN